MAAALRVEGEHLRHGHGVSDRVGFYVCSFPCWMHDDGLSAEGVLHCYVGFLCFAGNNGGVRKWIRLQLVTSVETRRAGLFGLAFWLAPRDPTIQVVVVRRRGSTVGRSFSGSSGNSARVLSFTGFRPDGTWSPAVKMLRFLWREANLRLNGTGHQLWTGFVCMQAVDKVQCRYPGDISAYILAAVARPEDHLALSEHFGLPTLLTYPTLVGDTKVEYVITVTECTFGDNDRIEVQGTLYLTPGHLCFRSDLSAVAVAFKGKAITPKIDLRRVTNITKTLIPPMIELLQVTTPEKVYSLRYLEEDFDVVFDALEAAWFAALQMDTGAPNEFGVAQMRKLLGQFRSINTTGSGILCSSEFMAVMGPLCGRQRADDFFNAFDTSHDGTVTFGEFVQGMALLLLGTPKDSLRFSFRVLDSDADGRVTLAEFQQIMLLMSDLCMAGLEGDVNPDLIFTACDTDGDGRITYEDFMGQVETNTSLSVMLNQLSTHLPSVDSRATMKSVSFGDPSWQLIVSLLHGIKLAIRCRDPLSAPPTGGLDRADTFSEVLPPNIKYDHPVTRGRATSTLSGCEMTPSLGSTNAVAVAAVLPRTHSPPRLAGTTAAGTAGTAGEVDGKSKGTDLRTESISQLKRGEGGSSGELGTPRSGESGDWVMVATREAEPSGIEIQLPHATTRLVEHRPATFERIRTQFGYPNNVYLQSLGLDLLVRNMLLGALVAPQEMSSSGKSGSYFFLSPDRRLVIKSLPVVEARTLLQMLPLYADHVLKHPNTLLVLFFGLYELIDVGGQSTFFIVMSNVFPSVGIEEVYDLKGSTAGRSTPMEHRRGPLTALKDCDLERLFVLESESVREAFVHQMWLDSDLLRRCDLMDYSMLVGIGSAPTDTRELAATAMGTERQFTSGLRSEEGGEVFYFGIIDVLTPFNAKRIAESRVKSVVQTNASCVPPNEYQQRLCRFLRSKIHSAESVLHCDMYGAEEGQPLGPLEFAKNLLYSVEQTMEHTVRSFPGGDASELTRETFYESCTLSLRGGAIECSVIAPRAFLRMCHVCGVGSDPSRMWNVKDQVVQQQVLMAGVGSSILHLPSASGGLLVTTLQAQTELDLFRQLLPEYLRHITANPLTLLVRVCALYILQIPDALPKQCAVLNRCTALYHPSWQWHEITAGSVRPKRPPPPDINISHRQRRRLMQHVAIDLLFLLENRMSNYRLVVGVWNMTGPVTLPQTYTTGDQAPLATGSGEVSSDSAPWVIVVSGRLVYAFMLVDVLLQLPTKGEVRQRLQQAPGVPRIVSPEEYAKAIYRQLERLVQPLSTEDEPEDTADPEDLLSPLFADEGEPAVDEEFDALPLDLQDRLRNHVRRELQTEMDLRVQSIQTQARSEVASHLLTRLDECQSEDGIVVVDKMRRYIQDVMGQDDAQG